MKKSKEKQITKKDVLEIDNIDTKKAEFVVQYRAPENGGNISTVCSVIGISRQTYYNWLEADEEFRKIMYDAKMEMCDGMEQQLYQRGYEKDTTALIYWLKSNHPNYKELSSGMKLEVEDGKVTVQVINYAQDNTTS